MIAKSRPHWWDWDLELSPHLLKRMVDRGFSEVDLRHMLVDVTRISPDSEDGRWVVESRLRGRPWAVIVEPDFELMVLVVVTAFPIHH